MPSRSKSANLSCNLFESHRGLNETTNLIESGQYNQLAELLRLSQVASEGVGQGFLAEMLSAALHICLACSQSRSEKYLYGQAEEEAGGREWELIQQLHALLKMIDQIRVSATPVLDKLSDHAVPACEHFSSGNPQTSRLQTTGHSTVSVSASDPTQVMGGPSAEKATKAPVGYIREEKETVASLNILCLGPFRVYRGDQMIGDWYSLKGLLILKYMVRHRETPVAKDILMDVFWPEADQDVARRNLHQAIYNLRQILRRGQSDFLPILFEKNCYLFNPEITLNLDFEAFEQHVQTGRRMEAAGRSSETFAEYRLAEELYRGDFLEQDPYEDWASLQREQIRNAYLEIADWLSEQQCRRGEYAAAIELCQKILVKGNCHEQAHRRLMRCYQCLGQRGSVIRQYRLCMEAMKRELDVPPSDETQSLLVKFAGSGKLNWLTRMMNASGAI